MAEPLSCQLHHSHPTTTRILSHLCCRISTYHKSCTFACALRPAHRPFSSKRKCIGCPNTNSRHLLFRSSSPKPVFLLTHHLLLVTMSSDLATLQTIFQARPFPPTFLEAVLVAHGSLPQACDYLSSLPDTEIPYLQPSRRQNIQLSSPESQQIVSNLKDIILPSLTSQLTGTRIPDFTAETDRIKYQLSQLCITTLSLPPSNVSIVSNDQTIRITATDISLDVAVGSWAYRIRMPPLRDAGAATFSCRDVQANIVLRVAGDNLIVEQCDLVVPEVTVRANEARLSWLYNSLASVARASVRKAVEAALQSVVRSALEEQLNNWTTWDS